MKKTLVLLKEYNADNLPVITTLIKKDNIKKDYFPYMVWNNNIDENLYSIYTALDTPKNNILVELEKADSEKDVYKFTKLLDPEIKEESDMMDNMYNEFFSDISEIIDVESKLIGESDDLDTYMIQ